MQLQNILYNENADQQIYLCCIHCSKGYTKITNMKTVFLFVCLVLAVDSASLHHKRKWIPLMPKVTPNPKAVPLIHILPKPKTRAPVPGTWKAESCGVAATSRIVNGNQASPHQFPWQVALYIDNLYFCGGSLISNQWVLTAGHCSTGAKSVTVVMGAQDLSVSESSQQSQTSNTIITHENYGATLLRNDVGLVKLPSPVTFNQYIQPVCLPSYSDQDLGADVMLTASGWGKTSDGIGGISDNLNYVTNPSISTTACQSVYGSVITDATICTATSDGNKGTCNGDSGGPLMWVSGGLTYSRGVTSFVSSAGCESGYPDGFTRTTHYLDWIETNTGIAIDP